MKRFILPILVGAGLVASADYKLTDRETVQHTFTGDKKLDVDIISGKLQIVADGGNSIRVEGERIIKADDASEIASAKKEVALDMNEKDGVAQVWQNGPGYRNNSHSSDSHGFHEDTGNRHYEIDYNLTLHVPKTLELKLKTVNGGMEGQGTAGNFAINTVNGKIVLSDLAGSGTISTVNGGLDATFRESPKADSSFTSVNGKVGVTFPPDLAASFEMHTVNGGMFSDFEPLLKATTPSRENGRFVYKPKGAVTVQIGNGGPHISMKTVNGQIEIRKGK